MSMFDNWQLTEQPQYICQPHHVKISMTLNRNPGNIFWWLWNTRAMSVEAIASTSRGPNAHLEGPHWDPVTQTLLYVEILSGKVHRYTPATDSVQTVDVGKDCIAVNSNVQIKGKMFHSKISNCRIVQSRVQYVVSVWSSWISNLSWCCYVVL